tara:strand:+ start:599 stop:763 length:165 start_codon:yes stop_codon:yes gene_type:complete
MSDDMFYGFVGVVAIFAFAFMWTWLEERSRAKRKRKYDQQMAEYDTLMKNVKRM